MSKGLSGCSTAGTGSDGLVGQGPPAVAPSHWRWRAELGQGWRPGQVRQGQARDWAGYRVGSDTAQARTKERPELRGGSWANRTRGHERRPLVRLVRVIKTN